MIWTFGKSSVPEAVTWQQLLEETHSDNKLSDVGYFRAQGKKKERLDASMSRSSRSWLSWKGW